MKNDRMWIKIVGWEANGNDPRKKGKWKKSHVL